MHQVSGRIKLNTQRIETDSVGVGLYSKTDEADSNVIQAVERVSMDMGVKMAQVGLAWVLSKPEVSAPIVGASTIEQLDDAIGALDVVLGSEQVMSLERPYVPHVVSGHE